MQLTGIHHLTAISAAIKDNHRFYTRTMGMRLVKRSVIQDDVSAYHLFYADAKGSPGTDLTFFDWPVPRERRGTRSIVRTGLRVNGEAALKWWAQRFAELQVSHVRAVGQNDIAFDARQLVRELLNERHECEIEQQHAVFGVIDDPGDLLRE